MYSLGKARAPASPDEASMALEMEAGEQAELAPADEIIE